MSLLEDLVEAEKIKAGERPCPLCEFIATEPDPETKAMLTAGAAGTIGMNRLADILRAHGTGIGRKTIERHRREDHS